MQTLQTRQDLYSVMAQRRSIRVLGNREILSPKDLEALIARALQFSPTAFHAQEQRAVLLLKNQHNWFWNLLENKLRTIVPAENFPDTQKKLKGFAGGVGTIFVYQDTHVTKGLQEKFPAYRDNFPLWAQQASGILKYTLWTSLVAEGYGVSLQHYTELIEEEVQRGLNIPSSWKMMGQIPFGTPEETPEEKDFMPLDQQFLIFS